MKYNRGARLDTSQVRDTRGGGGRMGGRSGVALGGGGLGAVGIVIYLLITLLGGGSGSNGGRRRPRPARPGRRRRPPPTTPRSRASAGPGQDANNHLDCAVVADIDSIQAYWAAELPKLGHRYTQVPTVWFTGQVNTGCGAASSGAGPFYCPADKQVYIDLSFYNDLHSEFGARGGLFVDAYVLAHEYGHHVQDLLGTSARVRAGATGPSSGSVRLELQADCYAGVWAHHATTTRTAGGGPPLVSDITNDDISRALDTAGADR